MTNLEHFLLSRRRVWLSKTESRWRAVVIWLCAVLLASQGIAIPTRGKWNTDLLKRLASNSKGKACINIKGDKNESRNEVQYERVPFVNMNHTSSRFKEFLDALS